MQETSERDFVIEKQSDDAATRLASVKKEAVHFIVGVQTAMIEEVLFAGYEAFDRTRADMHLFSEFASKVASAHSVGDLKTMWAECSRHQLDFIRRDCERLLRHSEQMIETTSRLFSKPPGEPRPL